MRFSFLLSLGALALFPVASQATTVYFSDNFDTNSGQGSISSGPVDSSTPWTFDVTSGNVDLVGPSFAGSLCTFSPESGSCVDMDGSTPGQITSTAITLPVGSYTLTFDITGNERTGTSVTTVTFGSYYSNQFTLNPTDLGGSGGLVTVNFSVVSPDVQSIVFTSNDPSGDASGSLIDNVQLVGPTVVPEPSTAVMLLAAVPLIWLARRRYARQAN